MRSANKGLKDKTSASDTFEYRFLLDAQTLFWVSSRYCQLSGLRDPQAGTQHMPGLLFDTQSSKEGGTVTSVEDDP
jgi:hypothetical protein